MLCQLIYVSQAVEPMTDVELTEILEAARSGNADKRVTGMLLYKNGRFMQILEGDEAAVEAVFAMISTDERHTDVRRIWMQYVQFRDFPDWTMGFQNIDTIDISAIPGYTPFLDYDFKYESFSSNSTEAHAILHAFKQGRQA